MNEKTPKQKLVASMERPFEQVDKSKRKSPLHQINSRDCDHEKAYKTDAYPTFGPTWVCVDCGKVTSYPEDLDG